jgi:hypothetical protein
MVRGGRQERQDRQSSQMPSSINAHLVLVPRRLGKTRHDDGAAHPIPEATLPGLDPAGFTFPVQSVAVDLLHEGRVVEAAAYNACSVADMAAGCHFTRRLAGSSEEVINPLDQPGLVDRHH